MNKCSFDADYNAKLLAFGNIFLAFILFGIMIYYILVIEKNL